jgi:hypothetical protein
MIKSGQIIKTKNKEFLVVKVDHEGDVIHLFDLKIKKMVYGILSLVKNENQLWVNVDILEIIPEEKVIISHS